MDYAACASSKLGFIKCSGNNPAASVLHVPEYPEYSNDALFMFRCKFRFIATFLRDLARGKHGLFAN